MHKINITFSYTLINKNRGEADNSKEISTFDCDCGVPTL